MGKALKEKIIRNTISCGASSTISILANFLLLPFMISRLGVIEYGLIGISDIFTVGGCMSLLEMGFQSSISKYVAEYNAKNNHIKIRRDQR
jgi:O-antigen/teichoic acid export membrane protein